MAGAKSRRGISGCAKAPRPNSTKCEILQSVHEYELRKTGDDAFGRRATAWLAQESGFTSRRPIQPVESAGAKLPEQSSNDAGERRGKQRGRHWRITGHSFSTG